MASICFYFQVHQPLRLRHYTVFDKNDQYFDDYKNGSICRKVANKCYLPANRLLLDTIRRFKGRFKIAYSITGVLLEQLQRYSPEVISTFDALAETGKGFGNYIMVLGVIETVALFVMVFTMTALPKL